ncbi:MAG: haloacid dehalogenase type II [Rhodospirillaceae bacterium]|nr:haloacid dehalogenase type II [Rhodospirillaceae bacterium]MBL6931074.1 haloacid dehalogenase type II [Rhodospirillales bacterium]
MKMMQDIDACVFDAYGTLFDVAAAAAHCREDLGDKADSLSAIWRTKQLEYTWLRSLMGEYIDFWQVTSDGLDYALETLGLDGDEALREKLQNLYMKLDCYPEVPAMLKALNSGGLKCAILSNGSPKMLASAVENAGISDDLVDSYSVDQLGIYKPTPKVYQMAVDGLSVSKERICFMSSNAWDAAAAANFGFRVVWVNRFGQKKERLPGTPEHEISTLGDLPPLLGL